MNAIFIDRLVSKIQKSNSCVCAGLDPRVDGIPRYIIDRSIKRRGENPRAIAEAFSWFCREIIEGIYNHVCAVKIQIAFFEQYGYWGIKSFQETAAYAKSKDLIVIADVKRNDIGSTAQAYSAAYLGKSQLNNYSASMGVDCITVNPYFGYDGIAPFISDLKEFHKGIFILVRTSNQSAPEIQDLAVGELKVYEIVAGLVAKWGEGTEGENGYNCVGAVVGATYPQEAKRLRGIMSKTYFLVPGYGAQGATADDIVSCFNDDGLGAIVNSSRDIIFAYKRDPWNSIYSERDFAAAARDAAIKMSVEINTRINQRPNHLKA